MKLLGKKQINLAFPSLFRNFAAELQKIRDMGTYINLGNAGFKSARNGEYVDKSELIAVVNKSINTEHQYSCVTRSRRFGKSMAAKMLCAYYDESCDSRSLFADLKIAGDPSFEEHLNKYPVIYLDLSEFMGSIKDASIVGINYDRETKQHTCRIEKS